MTSKPLLTLSAADGSFSASLSLPTRASTLEAFVNEATQGSFRLDSSEKDSLEIDEIEMIRRMVCEVSDPVGITCSSC